MCVCVYIYIYIKFHTSFYYIPNASDLQVCGSKSKMCKRPAVYCSEKVLWHITSFPIHIFVTPSNCFQKHSSFWRFPFSNVRVQLRHKISELLCFRPQVIGGKPNDVKTELSKVQVTSSLTWERQQSPLHKSWSSVAHYTTDIVPHQIVSACLKPSSKLFKCPSPNIQQVIA